MDKTCTCHFMKRHMYKCTYKLVNTVELRTPPPLSLKCMLPNFFNFKSPILTPEREKILFYVGSFWGQFSPKIFVLFVHPIVGGEV